MPVFIQFCCYRGDWENEQRFTIVHCDKDRQNVVIKFTESGPCAPSNGQARQMQLPMAHLQDYVRHLLTSIYYDKELTHVQIDGSFMPPAIYTLDSIVNPQRPVHLRDTVMGLVAIFQHIQLHTA